MAIIETCIVVAQGGARGWGLISGGVICPTLSWCGSEATAAGMAQHAYSGHTILRWSDDRHSHDATLHPVVPWSSKKWPPLPPGPHPDIVTPETAPETVAMIPAPPEPKLPPLAIIQSETGTKAIERTTEAPRKSLLVRRPLGSPPPPPKPAPELPPEPERVLVSTGLLVANAAPVKEDTATDNFRVYEPKKLTLAEKAALRKVGQ